MRTTNVRLAVGALLMGVVHQGCSVIIDLGGEEPSSTGMGGMTSGTGGASATSSSATGTVTSGGTGGLDASPGDICKPTSAAAVRIEGSGRAYAKGMAVLNDDAVFLGGSFGGSLTFPGDSEIMSVAIDVPDAFVARLGAMHWSHRRDGDMSDDPINNPPIRPLMGMALSAVSQSLIIMGADFNPNLPNSYKGIFVEGLSLGGGPLWIADSTGLSSVKAYSLGVTSDGKAVVTGLAPYPLVSFGPCGDFVATGTEDTFGALYETSGATAACSSIRLFHHGGIRDMVILDDISYVAGIDDSAKKAIVQAWDPSANVALWSPPLRFGDTGSLTVAEAIAADSSAKRLFIAGHFKGNLALPKVGGGTLSIDSTGGLNMFMVALDLNGRAFWAQRYEAGNLLHAAEDDAPIKMAVNAAGDVAFIGTFKGQIQLDACSMVNSQTNMVVAMFSGVDGSLCWSQMFKNDEDQRPRSVAFKPNGDLLVFGDFEGTLDTGAESITSPSENRSLFLLTYPAPTCPPKP